MRLLLCFLHVLHLTKSLGGGISTSEVTEVASAVETALEYNKMQIQASISPSDSSAKSLSPDDTVNDLYWRFMQIEGIAEEYQKHFFGDQATPGPGTSQESEEDFVSDESKHPELGKVTLSLKGTEITENGTSMDLVGMKFELDGNVLSLTERNFLLTSTTSGDITVSADIFYQDTREYKDGDWVSFSSEMTITTSGAEPTFTYELSNLKYKGETMSQADTDRVEKILMGEDPGTVDPGEDDENPASKEELLEFTSAFIDDAIGYDSSTENGLVLEDASVSRSVNVFLDTQANESAPGMKTEDPLHVSVGFSKSNPITVITFKGDLDIYSTEPKKMGTIHFADFKVWSPDNDESSVLSDGEFYISWEPNYEHNEKYYTQDIVAGMCYAIIMQLMSGQSVDGISTVGNVTDKAEISFEDYQLGDYQVADIRINTVKTYDNGRVYQDGSEITVSAIVDSEAYSADISIASGSATTSIDSAELSGFSSSASLDDINEELNGKFVEFYEAYSDIESGIVSQPQPSVPA